MPNEQKVTRKLRAILSADVKGYSILMADDEVFTIESLKTYRQIMSEYIKQRNGRVVDSPGDNLLAEFASAVDAVRCSVEIQKRLKKENELYVKDKRVQFRIGINLGDVVQDGDRIYGSGVNIAARIEGLADPGGLCISRSTYDQVKEKLELEFEYLGEHEVKNIKEPVRVYKALLDSDPLKPLVTESLKLPEKPSIAVLPFDNMSGDPNQEYFSDGLTEQIINGLCKVLNLFVIGRNSSFAYKGKLISTKQIAQELGVKYILEGSIQRAGDRVRITAQLLDATTDYHMWSESYDRNLEDLFALQDEITMKIMGAMAIKLTTGEQARIYEMETSNIQAYDALARGLDCFYRFNKQDNYQARLLFEQAYQLDENYAFAVALIGWAHVSDFFFNWSDNPLESFIEAEKYTHKALDMNDSLDTPHTLMAYIHLFKKEYDKAIHESKRAVALNPNGADAIAHLGFINSMTGKPEKGIILLKRAFRLNPIPQPHFYLFLGEAYRLTDQYEKAIEMLNHSFNIESSSVNLYLMLTSCYICLNDFEKAQTSVKKAFEIEPNLSLELVKNMSLQKDQSKLEKYIENLRKAGLPE